MSQKEKKVVQYKVNSQVKKKFESAFGFIGMNKHEAIEEAMKLFTDKYIKGVGENE